MKRFPSASALFITWLVMMTLVPFLIIFGMSFLSSGNHGTIELSFNLENYQRLFQLLYLKVLLKTLWMAFVATISCLCIGFPVAYFLARTQGQFRAVGMILLFIPFWTNFILRVYGMVSILGSHGAINQLLLWMGLIQEPLSILYTPVGVYLGLVYNYLPFLVVPIFSALEKLDPSLREAASDLGATRWQVFVRVVLPNIKEGLIVGSLFVFVPMLGEYVIPDLLGGAKEAYLGRIMVDQFFVMRDWPFGAAIAGLMSGLLIVGLWFHVRIDKQESTESKQKWDYAPA